MTTIPPGQAPYVAPDAVQVASGQMVRLDIEIDRDRPTVTIGAQSSGPLLVPVTVAGTAVDPGSGVASVVLRVLDSHGELRLSPEPIDGQGAPSVSWTRVLLLEVPSDPNPAHQTYTVEATATDRAGNTHTTGVTVSVAPSHPDRIIDEAKCCDTTHTARLCL